RPTSESLGLLRSRRRMRRPRFQILIEKLRARRVGGQPATVQQKIMNLIGEDQFLNWNVLPTKRCCQLDSLKKRYFRIVISLDQQHRRVPGLYGGEWRRFPRKTPAGVGIGRSIGNGKILRIIDVPVMHSGHVDPGGIQIRGTGQGKGSQKTTPASAPNANVGRFYIAAALQIESRSLDITELTGASCAVMKGFAKIQPITDSTAIVDGKHNVSLTGQVLVHGVGVGVIAH